MSNRHRSKPKSTKLGPQLVTASLVTLTAVLLSSAPAFAASTHDTPTEGHTACERGTICLWEKADFAGESRAKDLRNTNPGECVQLPAEYTPASLANRTDGNLVVFSDEHCSQDQKHRTYPGGGTYAPHIPFGVTAIKISK